MQYKSFTEMDIWQRAHKLAVEIFKMTAELPRSENYGLTSQIRRASNGIAACIAEGFGKSTNRDKSNFYIIARGSSYETQTHLLYGNSVGYFDNKKILQLCKEYDELIHDLNKLIKSLSHP